jgi:large subunit ribosomal protein L15
MKLNEIRENPASSRARKRIGRGIGSGKGKTGGRGVKGQKSRSGVAIKGFEGGQMPLHMRLPKRGFNNIFRKEYAVVNLGQLQAAVDKGTLDAKKPVNGEALVAAGLIHKVADGVKVLAKGELKVKLALDIAKASAAAVAAVEKAGGSVALPEPVPAQDTPAE